MTERDPEFLAFFDGLVERCLCRICGPARDHFVDPEEKMPKLVRMTNAEPEQIRASIRRLVRSGRAVRATRKFSGKTFSGIICRPRREWENPREPISGTLSLTSADVSFLRGIGVRVDPEDVREAVEVET